MYKYNGEAAQSIAGKTAAVLGASSPHGAATARLLAREGVNLVLGGRSRDRLEALEKEIEAEGGRAVVIGIHLAKRHHPAHLVQAAQERFGRLDILLFMAYSLASPLKNLELDSWERSVDVNVKGFLYSIAAALPVMREKGDGHVLVIGADDTQSPDPLYRASRAAVRVLLQELSRELSDEGIRTSEVRLADLSRTSPERCAESVCRLLANPLEASRGFTIRRIPDV